MKIFKIAIVVLLFLINLMVAQPSFAGKKLAENPDYIEVSKALDSLLQDKETQGATPENALKIANLQFQKYILETGEGKGVCRNETGTTLLVYGQKNKKSKSTYDNALYLLPNGQETDDEWDCDGVYVPSNLKVTGIADGQELVTPIAYKIVDGTKLVAKSNPETSAIEFNVPPAQIFKTSEVNWFIPDTIQAVLDTGISNAPIDD
ncbi:MAG: hypothetical protein PUP92_10945 [Rhizonema sp. PD38]|nr:hypothetical protein [Rhizonema sp. PD38]